MYFTRGLDPGLKLIPTIHTHATVEKTGLLVRSSPNGIRVFYDHHSLETLRLFADNPDEPLQLVFKAYAEDLWFSCYTELPAADEDSILYFDNRNSIIDESDRLKLHTAEHVSEKDLVKLNTLPLAEVFNQRDHIVTPEFVVCIHMAPDEIRSLEQPSKNTMQKYFISFKARETFWKYYLIGNISKKKCFIVDLKNETEFEDTGQTSLPGGRNALTFRSKRKIPLQEESEFRFQLKEKGPNGGKVVIKRLPVASASQFCREIIDGKETIVSEIFINY